MCRAYGTFWQRTGGCQEGLGILKLKEEEKVEVGVVRDRRSRDLRRKRGG